MTVWEYVIGFIIIILALIVVVVVLMQEGRQANLGAISGAADTFMEKGKARRWDDVLARCTKWLAIAFFVAVLAGMFVTKFLGA